MRRGCTNLKISDVADLIEKVANGCSFLSEDAHRSGGGDSLS
jgi:hypothetical protein